MKIKWFFKFKSLFQIKNALKTLLKFKTNFENLNYPHHQPSCLPHLSPHHNASLSLSKTWYGNLISEISFNNKSAFIVSFLFFPSRNELFFSVHKVEYYAKLAKDFTVNSFFFFVQLDFARARNGCQEHNKVFLSVCEYLISTLCLRLCISQRTMRFYFSVTKYWDP